MEDLAISYFDRKDKGFVKIYHDHFKNSIVCSSIQNKVFFMFDPSISIWNPVDYQSIVDHFMDVMPSFFIPLVLYYESILDKLPDKSNSDNKLVKFYLDRINKI